MAHNGAPPLDITDFPRQHLHIDPSSGTRLTAVVCPGCGEWRKVQRRYHMIEAHTCPYGGQRVWIDIDTEAIERHWRNHPQMRSALADPNAVRMPDGKPRSRNPFEWHHRNGVQEPARTSPPTRPSIRAGLAPRNGTVHTRRTETPDLPVFQPAS